jgi:hypothetical protein
VLDFVVLNMAEERDKVKTADGAGQQTVDTCDLAEAVIADLEPCEAASRYGTNKEVLAELDVLMKNFANLLQEEEEHIKHHPPPRPHPASSEVSVTDQQYFENLTAYITTFAPMVNEIRTNREIMCGRSVEVIEYFGEDARECEVSKVFSVLLQFRRGIMTSRDLALKKIKQTRDGKNK